MVETLSNSENWDKGIDSRINGLGSDVVFLNFDKTALLTKVEWTEGTENVEANTYGLSDEQIKTCNSELASMDAKDKEDYLVKNLDDSLQKTDNEILYKLDKVLTNLKQQLRNESKQPDPDIFTKAIDWLWQKLLSDMNITCEYSDTAPDHIYCKIKPNNTRYYTKYFTLLRDCFFTSADSNPIRNYLTNTKGKTAEEAAKYPVPKLDPKNIGRYSESLDDNRWTWYKQYRPKDIPHTSNYDKVRNYIWSLNEIFATPNILADQNANSNPFIEKFKTEVNNAKEQYKKDNPKKFKS